MDIERVHTYPHPTMDSYVGALGERLEFDADKLFSAAAAKGRFEDSESINNPDVWLREVSMKDGAEKNLPRARIEADFGRKTYVLDGKTGFTENEEAAPKEVLLNTLALGEAKLRVVRENIPDAYPLLQLRVNNAIKDAVKTRENLLRQKHTKKLSLKDLVERSQRPEVEVNKAYGLTAGLTSAALLLAACGPVLAPTQADIDASENQPKVIETTELPNPQVGITRSSEEETATPTTEEEINNFGLATQESEWPGTGVNIVDLANVLYETDNLTLARHIEKDSQDWNDIEAVGGDIGGLIDSINTKLKEQGNNNASLQVVRAPGDGWAIEVRDGDGSLMWSYVENPDGTKTWQQHPDRITDDSHFAKLDHADIGLDDGEKINLAVEQGTVMGIVVNADGETVGVFNPQTGKIERFVQAQLVEVTKSSECSINLGFIAKEEDKEWLNQFTSLSQEQRAAKTYGVRRFGGNTPLSEFHEPKIVHDDRRVGLNTYPILLSEPRIIDVNVCVKELDSSVADGIKEGDALLKVPVVPGLIQDSKGKYAVVNYLIMPSGSITGMFLYKNYVMSGSSPEITLMTEDLITLLKPGKQYEATVFYLTDKVYAEEILREYYNVSTQVIPGMALAERLNDETSELADKLRNGEELPDGIIIGPVGWGMGVTTQAEIDSIKLLEVKR